MARVEEILLREKRALAWEAYQNSHSTYLPPVKTEDSYPWRSEDSLSPVGTGLMRNHDTLASYSQLDPLLLGASHVVTGKAGACFSYCDLQLSRVPEAMFTYVPKWLRERQKVDAAKKDVDDARLSERVKQKTGASHAILTAIKRTGDEAFANLAYLFKQQTRWINPLLSRVRSLVLAVKAPLKEFKEAAKADLVETSGTLKNGFSTFFNWCIAKLVSFF